MRREKMTDVLEHPMREGAPPYIPRELDAKFPATGKCVTIVGPRRAGKTYFLYQRMDELRRTAPDEGLLYVNFEDERLIGLRLEDMDTLLRTFRELHPGSPGRRLNAFLDEVQAVTGWERFVRRLIDTEDIRIHITGSSSKLLSTEIGTSMRGRSLTYTLLPFSFREYLTAKGVRVGKHPSSGERAAVLAGLAQYMRFGGFPQVVLESDEAVKADLVGGLLETMLVRDVIERYKVRNIGVLRLLVSGVLTTMGREFSVNRFHAFARSREMRVSKNTLYDYLRYLEDALIITTVRRQSRKPREMHWSLPKVYPIDTALAAQLRGRTSEDHGRFMECIVAIELLRRRVGKPLLETLYWKDARGREVDFVVKEGVGTTSLIQVCYDLEGMGTREREYKPLVKASRELGCKDLMVLTWDEWDEEEFEGRRIRLVPLWRWLLGLDELARP